MLDQPELIYLLKLLHQRQNKSDTNQNHKFGRIFIGIREETFVYFCFRITRFLS